MEPIILNPLMYERGRGPELRRVRITVFDLIPYLEHDDYSDARMLELWPITAEELAALKQYIADHHDEVMAKHYEIESRIIRDWAAQCTPENLARWAEARRRATAMREWISDRKREGTLPPVGERLAAFRAWWEANRPAPARVAT